MVLLVRLVIVCVMWQWLPFNPNNSICSLFAMHFANGFVPIFWPLSPFLRYSLAPLSPHFIDFTFYHNFSMHLQAFSSISIRIRLLFFIYLIICIVIV